MCQIETDTQTKLSQSGDNLPSVAGGGGRYAILLLLLLLLKFTQHL